MRELYHYTCAHSAPGIDEAGAVLPMPQLAHRPPLAWFTDLPRPVPREAVGLTSHLVGCDRTEACYLVGGVEGQGGALSVHGVRGVVPWVEWRRGWLRTSLTELSTQQWREARVGCLELEQAGMPRHWWVSQVPVPIVRRLD